MNILRDIYNKYLLPNATAIAIILILVLASVLRFYQIGKLSFEGDELSTMWFVAHPPKEILKIAPDMFLYHFLVHYWIKFVTGTSEGQLRIINALFSIVSVWMVYVLGKEIGINSKKGIAIGLVAAFLSSINAFNIQYAQEMRAYSLVSLLTVLSTYLLIRAVNKDDNQMNNWWIWYVIVATACIYSHFLSIFLIMGQFVSFVVLVRRKAFKFPLMEIIGSATAIMILIVPLVISIRNSGNLNKIKWIPETTYEVIKDFAISVTGNQGESLLILYLVAMIVGLMIGMSRFIATKNAIGQWKMFLLTTSVIVPPVIAVFVSMIITPVFVPRYLMLVIPYISILVAMGIVIVFTIDARNLLAKYVCKLICVLLLIQMTMYSSVGVSKYFNEYKKEDFRGVAHYMSDECSGALRLFQVFYSQEKIAYYSSDLKSQIPQKEWTKELGLKPTGEELLQFLPTGYDKVCVVVWSNESGVRKLELKTVREALNLKYTNMTIIKFEKINIEIYEK